MNKATKIYRVTYLPHGTLNVLETESAESVKQFMLGIQRTFIRADADQFAVEIITTESADPVKFYEKW